MNEFGLFLENGDLLEEVELSLEIEDDGIINEATFAGMKVTKENLQDEEFVKELTKKIRSEKHKLRDNIIGVIGILGMISFITIIGAPIGLLLIALTTVIKNGDQINEKHLKQLDDTYEKTIEKLKKKESKTKDKDEKDELNKVIKQLEETRKFIYNQYEEEQIKKLVDSSKYSDRGIKIGSGQLGCEVADLLKMKKGKLYEYSKSTNVNDIKQEFKLNKDKVFTRIEQLYMNGIKSKNDLLNYFIKNKTEKHKAIDFGVDPDDPVGYGDTVNKYLQNKTLSIIIDLHDNFVLYCYDDDCCYIWFAEENDNITKVSINDLLKASKQSYEDLVKIVNYVK